MAGCGTLLAVKLPDNWCENVVLAPLTTFRIGGPARFFCAATTEAELSAALRMARRQNLPVFVLGGGSNVLISDCGFPGLVVQIACKEAPVVTPESDGATVTAFAGTNWDDFVAFCVARNLAGVECLSGIPGSVGGTPVQNVGAYGQEVSQTMVSVRALDQNCDQIVTLTNADCAFQYRRSRFNTMDRGRFVILAVTFRLNPNGSPLLAYKDLAQHFADSPMPPTLGMVRDAVLVIRARKGMVLDANDPDTWSAGSFFKNPVVETTIAARILADFPDAPHWPQPDHTVKFSAAWLIEQAGFSKGYRRGNVGLSTKHTLALTNRGAATAAEIVLLKNEIQAAVESHFGVSLTPEPVFVGFESEEK